MPNESFFFIKPHAITEGTLALVKETLAARKIAIVGKGDIRAADIDTGGLIDKHYGTLAERAMSVAPIDLPVWEVSSVIHSSAKAKAAAFEEAFGESHAAAAADGRLLNLKMLMERMPALSTLELEKEWRAGKCLKLSPGTYCAQMGDLYCVNGFYGSMREKVRERGGCCCSCARYC